MRQRTFVATVVQEFRSSMRSSLRKRFVVLKGNVWHILPWFAAVLYLLLAPSFSYHFFVEDGKPVEMLEQPPEETGGIRYNVEDLKYWAGNMAVYKEGEMYALWGWAFLDIGKKVALTDFGRFVVLSDQTSSYVFPTQVYLRPGAQQKFKDLGLDDLASSGFYAVISRNALSLGTYSIGLLFIQKHDGKRYYVKTNRILKRTPNHLKLRTSK